MHPHPDSSNSSGLGTGPMRLSRPIGDLAVIYRHAVFCEAGAMSWRAVFEDACPRLGQMRLERHNNSMAVGTDIALANGYLVYTA